MRTRPEEQQCSTPEKQTARDFSVKDETQSTSECAADVLPIFMIQDVSMDDYPEDDSIPSVLNDDGSDVLFTDRHIYLVNERVGNGSPIARARSAHDAEHEKTTTDLSNPHLESLNQPVILPQWLLLEQPSSSSGCPDGTDFDPIRPCRGVSAPLPPPRRFYAFWWRGVARAAYDAQRVARLHRARAGGAD
jgi:hypothetical protein